MKKIYLSPSNQTGNKFITGNTSEGTVWLDIAKKTASLLREYECEVKISLASQNLSTRAVEAAAWGADVYIAMHSNAAGTANKGAHGVEVYYSPKKGEKTKVLAQAVLDQLSTMFTSRGLRTSTTLIDCYKPLMPSIIGECGFHDNYNDAVLILENKEKIAGLYCKALVNYLGLQKKPAPAPVEPVRPLEPIKPDIILTAGAELKLSKEPLYVSASAAARSSTVTGTYYYWGGSVVNGRIRITNSKSRVGIAGQVTGWINHPVVVIIYKVKAGDTLNKIASAYKCTLAEILKLNPEIKNPDIIHVGDLIKIPVK